MTDDSPRDNTDSRRASNELPRLENYTPAPSKQDDMHRSAQQSYDFELGVRDNPPTSNTPKVVVGTRDSGFQGRDNDGSRDEEPRRYESPKTEAPKDDKPKMFGRPKQDTPKASKPASGGNHFKADFSSIKSGNILDAIKGMLSFFTILPIKAGEKEIAAMESNFHFAPLVGLIIGLIAAVVCLPFVLIDSNPLLIAAVCIATVFIVSKFLHFDGLADFGDGIVASGDREKHVKALKDTAIGAGGLGLALIVTLISVTGLMCFGIAIVAIIVLVEIGVKNSMVITAAFGEPGNGMAANQVKNAGMNSVLISTILSAILCIVLYVIVSLLMAGAVNIVSALLITLVFIGGSIVSGWIVAKIANSQFGFVNGDVLGASNEISRAIIVIFGVLLVGLL